MGGGGGGGSGGISKMADNKKVDPGEETFLAAPGRT